MKYILWGIGKCGTLIWEDVKDYVEIVIDGNEKLWGNDWNGFKIQPPEILKDKNISYDKIIIASVEWRFIKKDIMNKYGVDSKYIDNMYFFKRRIFLERYVCSVLTEEQKVVVDYVRDNPLDVFNYEFAYNYIKCLDDDVKYDAKKELFYVYHCGKKMYFSRYFKDKHSCVRYYNALLMEQDINSPHRYLTEKFNVNEEDIVLDAGVAEGNFALEIIDRVKKIYLVECDELWIEALKYTFADYKDKVEIVQAVLGDGSEESLTIDEILSNEKVSCIKMDIEGAEIKALKGARNTLQKNKPKMLCCTYHNANDYSEIKGLLETYNYNTEPSAGYMVFVHGNNEMEQTALVRGIIRGR